MKKPTPKPSPTPTWKSGETRTYSYIGEMPKKYSPQYKSPAELSDMKKDDAASRRNVSNATAGDKSRGYVKDGKYRPTEVQTSDYRKFRRAEAMPVEAKRDAIAAARKKAGNKVPSGDMSYEEVQRLKKSGKFKGMDFSSVGVKG